MKNRNFAYGTLVLAMSLFVTSCSNDDEPEIQTVTVIETVTETVTETVVETVEVDSSLPVGDLTVVRTGSLVAENATPTAGTVALSVDTNGTNFIHFNDDFMTVLATGTVSIFLSTSAVYTASPGEGNPDLSLIGQVKDNGEVFVKLDAAPDDKFTHLILWCGTAGIPFGNVELL